VRIKAEGASSIRSASSSTSRTRIDRTTVSSQNQSGLGAQIVHPNRTRVPERAAFSDLNLKLDSYFHNLRAWNFEICTRPLSVVMHEGE
jgi:hypothetical protein